MSVREIALYIQIEPKSACNKLSNFICSTFAWLFFNWKIPFNLRDKLFPQFLSRVYVFIGISLFSLTQNLNNAEGRYRRKESGERTQFPGVLSCFVLSLLLHFGYSSLFVFSYTILTAGFFSCCAINLPHTHTHICIY